MEQIANNAQSTLASGISAGALSLTVADPSSFPGSGDFRLIIDSEYLLVTAVAGSTFTVTRGVESSTAASHAAGAVVTHELTVGGLTAFITENAGGGAVDSVNGHVGVVVLGASDVGLGNVDNTADTAKPVSTAQQTALDLKANLTSPALAGNPTAPTASAGDNDTSIATTAFVHGEVATEATARGTVASDLATHTAQTTGAHGGIVASSDARLTDARTPTDGSVTLAKVNTALKPSGTAAAGDESLRALGTSASTAAAGNDARLSDTRTPTDGSVTAAKVAASLKPSGTAAAGTEALRALGTSASTAAAGNDSRLSDARTPTAHASSHASGGSDAVTISESQVTNLTTDLAAKAIVLTRTAVKTANYTAAANESVPCDTTSGSFTVTLPNAPADKSRALVKQILRGGTNTVTVACAGSDTINRTGGATSLTLTLLAEGALLQYDSGSATWTVQANDAPLSQLDLRYAAIAATAGGDLTGTYPNPTVKASVALTGTPTVPTAAGGTNTTQAASTAFVAAAVAGVAAHADVQTFDASGTWTKPSGATAVRVVCIGAGGGGGGGASSVSTAKAGGGGGGGGAVSVVDLRAADLGSTETVTVGTGGPGGGGGASGAGANGSAGTDGGMSSFGSRSKAGGGGAGPGGTSSGSAGGGGGSAINSAVGATAGAPASTSAIASQGSTGSSASNGANADWGGASGAGMSSGGSGLTGGSSIFGGPGGGTGGGVTVGNSAGIAGIGGSTQAYTAGGGAARGTGGASPTAGTAGSFTGPYCGGGGGGGGAGTGVAGAVGGAGGTGAGGGGGGASSSATSSAAGAAGGAGGNGRVIVISW